MYEMRVLCRVVSLTYKRYMTVCASQQQQLVKTHPVFEAELGRDGISVHPRLSIRALLTLLLFLGEKCECGKGVG